MSLTVHSLIVFLTVVTVYVSNALAAPAPTFDDVEKAWKEGHSEPVQHPTPSWHLARSDDDDDDADTDAAAAANVQSRVSGYVAAYLVAHDRRSAAPPAAAAARQSFQGVLDERTMAARSADAAARRGASTAQRVRDYVLGFVREDEGPGPGGAGEEGMAPVLRPRGARRWSLE
ncbi:hypothetical protein MBLNU459_g7475t2 [Dothideomycetes sp. NU459]